MPRIDLLSVLAADYKVPELLDNLYWLSIEMFDIVTLLVNGISLGR